MSYEPKLSRDCDDSMLTFPYLPRLRKYVVEVYDGNRLMRRQRFFGVFWLFGFRFEKRLDRKLKHKVEHELKCAKLMSEAERIAA